MAAVNRAISLLHVFTGDERGLSLSEIARRSGFYKSTVLRLAGSLLAHDLLERDSAGHFRLGRGLIRMGDLAKRTRRSFDDIRAVLELLTERTGESATYYVRQGNERLALFRIDSPRSIRDHIRAGDLLPIDRGAAGRVFGRHDGSGTGKARRFEVIVSRGERDPEVAAAAGPVYVGDRLEGVLSISGPKSRFQRARGAAALRTARGTVRGPLRKTRCRGMTFSEAQAAVPRPCGRHDSLAPPIGSPDAAGCGSPTAAPLAGR